jgi:hypothetical protein
VVLPCDNGKIRQDFGRIVCAAPPNGGLAYEKPQSALRAFVRFFSGTFFCALETYGFLYRAQKNVAYNRDVKRNRG